MAQTAVNRLITQKMIDEHIQPNPFTTPLHTLPADVRKSLNWLLETSIGTIHLTKMQTDMDDSESVSQKP